MLARRICTGIAAVALSVSALGIAGTAHAVTSDPSPDDTSGTPVAADLIGVGSDTTQGVVKVVGDAYNATNPTNPIFTYAACVPTCGTITLPSGDITRPNGSGAGKTLLYGTTNNTDIDFARSSSALNTTEQGAGLQAFPYAVDTLVMATSGQVATHAPASLTVAQILDIYKGNITNWSQVGGTSGTIKPLVPQSGSGTLSFFTAQLTAANGGAAFTYGSDVVSVQEHDPAPIQDDANAIAPFSQAKYIANGYSSILHVEPGFAADRAVYNVVRGSDVSSPAVLAAFGSNGFFCSAAGKSLIASAGFRQLLPPSQGGACGAPTQSATTNLTTQQVGTSTTVAVSSATTSTQTAAKIVATVSASSAPSGTVSFYEGSTLLASNVPLVSGAATRTQPTTAGSHTYRAVFTPAANTAFTGSEGSGSGTVTANPVTPAKSVAKAKEGFKKSYVVGKVIKGKVKIKLAGGVKATGKVKVLLGKKIVGKAKLKKGSATVVLKHLKVGKNKLTLVWGGDAHGKPVKKKFVVTVVRAQAR